MNRKKQLNEQDLHSVLLMCHNWSLCERSLYQQEREILSEEGATPGQRPLVNKYRAQYLFDLPPAHRDNEV